MLTNTALHKLGAGILLLVLSCAPAMAQATDGNLAGVVLDPTGAAVTAAKVRVENLATGLTANTTTDAIGTYRFPNLPVGRYKLTTSAAGFQTVTLSSVNVELSNTNTQHVSLTVGIATETITVTDTPSLIQATTAYITNLSTDRMAADHPTAANPTGGYLNDSLLGAGVASSGGTGAGTGPSIGGQRPRNNNHLMEGADNNRKDITGPLVLLPNDAVQEFTVMQNQFSAEFGHSSGGQFNTVLRSGTNQVHGRLYEYFQNRNLNALDSFYRLINVNQRLRYDQNMFGGNLGGPIKKEKLFYFASLDFTPTGRTSPSSVTPRYAPTAAGYALLESNPGLSQTNVGVLKQYVGTGLSQASTVSVLGGPIPVGIVPEIASSYSNGNRTLGSLDYNMSENDQWRGRFVQNRTSGIDTGATQASFWTKRPTTAYLASISEFHTFSPTKLNELRLAFNRFNDRRMPPDFKFPGLDTFPTLYFNDLALTMGPLDVAPQITVQNTYQIADNFTWNLGRHDLKFGFDGRDAISAMDFLAKVRGEYRYSTLNGFLRDQRPDFSGTGRLVGGKPYSGNALYYYLYANDNWRVTRRLTLNLGVRWEYNGIPKSMKEQALNSISDVPGVITFRAPKAQLSNFAPRFGFAYAPGNSGRTSIRGGFGIAYDQIFDNIGTNVRPPQTGGIQIPAAFNPNANSFLATGGIPSEPLALGTDVGMARQFTTGYMPDQKLGYAINWNLGMQQSIGQDWVVDVRYLGSRGVNLLLQSQLNRISRVTATNSLPTYLARPTTQELDALPLTLAQLQSGGNNAWFQYGFTNPASVTAYTPEGASIYHGLAIDVNKRFSRQLLFKGAYTWSHLRDNSTAEINTTSLTPRRPQDFNNLKAEWADSLLDRRHRLTLAWVWDTPWFRTSNGWLRNVLGNYSFSGAYTAESPQYVTPQSGFDANLNNDAASDRVIINPNGTPGVGSDTSELRNSANQVVGYLAANPNAYYLTARPGAFANSGRSILPTNSINNFDLGVTKAVTWKDHYRAEIRADFFNAFNHSQYTPGRINNIASSPYTSAVLQVRPNNPEFGKWDRVFANNARNIQLVAKFIF